MASTGSVAFGVASPDLHSTAGNAYTATDVARAASDIEPGSIVRVEVSWARVQPQCFTALGTVAPTRALCQTPGPIDWTRGPGGAANEGIQNDLDEIAPQLASGQVKILLMVIQAPRWAWGRTDVADPNEAQAVMPPGDDTQALGWWRQFAQATVHWMETRYGPDSLAGLEVWNEPNLHKFWTVSFSSSPLPGLGAASIPKRYANVLCYAFRGARAADPQLPVIFAGLSATGTDNGDAIDFLNAAYSAVSSGVDIRQCMTSIGMHPYNDLGGTFVPPDTPDSPLDTVMHSVDVASCAHGDCGRDVSITEFGYYPGLPKAGGQTVTLQDQADWNAQAYDLMKNTPRLDMFVIYSLFNDVWAICRHHGTDNPAPNELAQTISGDPSATVRCWAS
ncbi:MAG TPA: hypothetical protein VHA79_02640 [Mycobacteriales bacterium]|nr:hypothetical protein [Mycobacteriales bacterium]